MAHPNLHAKSSVRKWGGKPEDYIAIHDWLDETKSWVGHSIHRMFRHHSEGILKQKSYLEIVLLIQMVKQYIQDMLQNNM